jgi:hypothetical protein
MAISDALNMFSDSQAVTATANATGVIDLRENRDIGAGEPVDIVFSVTTAFTAGGSATLTIQIVYSAATNLGTPTEIFNSGAIAVATLVAGYRLAVKIARATPLRYLGVIYTVATGPMLTGAIEAYVSGGVQDRRTYARGYTIA